MQAGLLNLIKCGAIPRSINNRVRQRRLVNVALRRVLSKTADKPFVIAPV